MFLTSALLLERMLMLVYSIVIGASYIACEVSACEISVYLLKNMS